MNETKTPTQTRTTVDYAWQYANERVKSDRRLQIERTATFITLDVVFLASCAAISYNWQALTQLPAHTAILLAFATMRTAHTFSYNGIMEWARAPFTQVEEHSSGAGDDVHARGKGAQRVIGELIECPVCTGTWAALALVAIMTLYPPLGIVLAWVLGLAGVSELFHYAKESMEWHAMREREDTGFVNRLNRAERGQQQ